MLSNSIEVDARRNSKLKADLDNFRSQYIEIDFENGFFVQFPSGEIRTYEQSLFINIANAKLVDFKPRWTMRPDYTSFDMYGTEIYWTLILHVNGIYTMEEFRGFDSILIPSVSSLLNVVRSRLPKNEISQIISNPPERHDQSLTMLSRYPLDELEIQKIHAETNLSDDEQTIGTTYEIVSKSETFTLETDDITNQFIVLEHPPVNPSSITLHVDGFSIPQRYGYDYILKESSYGRMDIISWASSDVIGDGMESLLVNDMQIDVTYLYQRVIEG